MNAPAAPRLALPIAALFIASMASCALLLARDWITGSWRQLYLPWNLFLAWLPLLFSWRAVRAHAEAATNATPRERWRFRFHALAWLLFFPNAPYILTDLWHLPPNREVRFWVDLVLILLFALIGLVVGFLSLYLMQRLVARRCGWVRGWLFTFGIAALSGGGLCIGRFLRWNSWDVLMNPGDLLVDVFTCAWRLSDTPRLLVVPVLFAILTFIAYVILYALTRLPAPQEPRFAP